MLVPWLSLFDLRTTFTNFMKTEKISYKRKSNDFVILIPIFNDTKYLTNINFLKKYRQKVILCTTDIETPNFYKSLDKIAKDNGFNVVKCRFQQEAKNPWKIYQKTLLAHDYVLGKSIKEINAKYVIFLDADTTCKTNLSYLAGEMDYHELDLASVRVIPSKQKTIMEKLQRIEYHVAMKSRKIYPWLTSGAAMIGKRENLIEIMDKHSLFFNGGDIEIGKLANLDGLNVGHIPVTFYTDIPETPKKLIKQRLSWFCGAFRHCVVNAHTNVSHPIYSFYFTFIIFLMLPLKIYELFVHWFILPFLFLFYFVLTFISNWEIRNKYMLLFPLYSLFQVIVMPILGIYIYGRTVYQTKNIGMIKSFYKKGHNPFLFSLKIVLIFALAFFIFNIHLVEGKLMLSDIDLFSLVGIDFHTNKNIPVIIYNGLKLTILLTSIFLFLYGFFKTKYHLKIHFDRNKSKYPKIFQNVLTTIL